MAGCCPAGTPSAWRALQTCPSVTCENVVRRGGNGDRSGHAAGHMASAEILPRINVRPCNLCGDVSADASRWLQPPLHSGHVLSHASWASSCL
jgi:hypothetical protein